MPRLRASVQYGDWRGSAAADDIFRGDLSDYLQSIDQLGEDEFLVGVEMWLGENHPGRPIEEPFVTALISNRGDFDTLKAKLSAQKDPIPLRRVRLDLTLAEFFGKFKRFSITILRNGLGLEDREYIDTAELKAAALSEWDEVQLDPLTMPPENLRRMARDEAIRTIREWFLENFEDPAESTPYESAEGGYQYIWGGPYETRDIIENIFADSASDDLVTDAIAHLERISSIWVPNSNRQQPPEDDQSSPPQEIEELKAELLDRIEALEAALVRPEDTSPGIGHNNPPERLDPEPLDLSERRELSADLAELKAVVTKNSADISAIQNSQAKLEAKRSRLGAWLLKLGATFTEEAVKEAGKAIGRKIGNHVAWAPSIYVLWITGLLGKIGDLLNALIKLMQ
ncbi:MAG: HEPN-associated N-terminal domain-containing protein [Rhodospirillaceae bacterium]